MAEVYQRSTGRMEEERIFGERALHFTCNTKIGQILTNLILKRKLVSKIVAHHYKTRRSAKKIPAFLQKYHIDRLQLSKAPEEYRSFNEFFTRKLERPYSCDPDLLISPADSRLIVHKIEDGTVFSVKGQLYTTVELLSDRGQTPCRKAAPSHRHDFLGNDTPDNPINSRENAKVQQNFSGQGSDPRLQNREALRFRNGLCLVFRLCPTDYHRFCFPDSGTWDEIVSIKGNYNTVNTFFTSGRVHATNYREKAILHTENFGEIAFVEVGAMLIGKIVRTAECPGHFTKGQEKGYFEYGASTIVMLLEEGRVHIDEDILAQSARGVECVVKYGEVIGRKL